MDQFEAFNFAAEVMAGIEKAGYTTPTPIQKEAIPSVMDGRDVMGLAQTGTGKTAAFGLPIIHRLIKGKRGQVRALIIAPTRELAEQIHQAMTLFGRQTGLQSVAVYGGVNINTQIQKLRRGADIVVSCPGRLLDHIGQRTIDLRRLEVLVLDEADHMFDMGFIPDIRRILKAIPSERQTLLFSATMSSEIRRLAKHILTNPVTIQAGSIEAAVTVTHALYPVTQQLKTRLLRKLLQETNTESVLIFTRTKHRAKRLGEQLAKSGYRVSSLQGNLSQSRRQAALNGFRDGTFQILVATDIAARGIDVSQVSHVINYDIPDTPEAYIHRIGRTGRAAKSGDAFTLVTDDDRSTVCVIERVLGFQIKRCTIKDFDYKATVAGAGKEFARVPYPQSFRRNISGTKNGNRQERFGAQSHKRRTPKSSGRHSQG